MFSPNEDQALLTDSVAKFVERHYSYDARHKMGETPLDESIWGEIAEQGWLMLPYTEEYGGLRSEGETGAGDMAVLFEALGHGLIVEPVISSAILAGGLIYDSPTAAHHKDTIEGIASGSIRAAAALHEIRARHDLTYCATTAEKAGDGWTLNGTKAVALGGASAHLFVVIARIEGKPGDGAEGLGLFLVPQDCSGLTVTPYRLRDDHWAADVKLDGVKLGADALLAGPGEAGDVLDSAVAKTHLCLSAEAVGIMQHALDVTTAYAKERRQFGKALAEFQVVQHNLADMSITIEQVRSLLFAAVSLAQDGWTPEAKKAAARAHKAVKRDGVAIAKKAVQLHGGMGMSEEMPLGRLLRRVMTISLLFETA